MQVTISINVSSIFQALFLVVFVFAFSVAARPILRIRACRRDAEFLRCPIVKAEKYAAPERGRGNAHVEEMQLHKDLYFKLQNLEQYPEILPQARDLLILMFSETLADACKSSTPGILSITHYTRENLATFLKSEYNKATQQWEEYLARRKAGCAREMFGDREEAKWWLKQAAPVKYVDGAWLGHINKITTPFAFRRASKDAWQILSEELGDGDPDKNHVHVYHELMKEIGSELPEAHTADFIHPRHELDEPRVWKAAVAQLLISLFPHEFLPEILGFNMHFEGVTLETMKAAKELGELKLNAYYFLLHIAIDNADSGHTAIAMQAAIRYIEHTQRTSGDPAAQQAWKRVQVGFILSEGLPTTPDCSPLNTPAVDSFPRNESEAEVIKVFKSKALVAHKIHCSSQIRIRCQTLVDWLEPGALASKQWQMDFLDGLSNTRPWVYKGDSSKSKLVQELSWGGKMFGSFTQNEVEVVRRWIDSLGRHGPGFYWSIVSRAEITSYQVFQSQDIRVDYPVFSSISANSLSTQPTPSSTSPPLTLSSTIKTSTAPNMSKLLPLWFTHPCLLESFICIPTKTTTKTASSIIRLLRAQSGFGAECPGIAGMDEVRRTESIGLVEFGLEMAKRSGLREPTCPKDVLVSWPSEFALSMLHLSMRPMENAALLLGLAWAFVGLHDAIAASPTMLLSAAHREVLRQMARRERGALQICLEELKEVEVRYADFCRGCNLGRAEIENSFGENGW
jgi:hypothetical protein